MSSNDNKTLNVPNLRFPEFSGEWNEYKLKDNFIFKNGLNKEKESFGFGTPIVNYMDVNKNRFLYTENIKGLVNVNEKELENYSVEKGDVFFTRTSETSDEIGLSSVVLDKPEKTVFSGFVLRARPFTNNLLPEFCAYSFSNKRVRNEIIKKSSITTRALTSGTSLNEVINFYPSLDEQLKISSLMILLEKKIQTQMKIIEKYESLIKGIRHTMYLESIKYNKYKLSDLCTIKTGKLDANAMESNGKYPFYTCAKEIYKINSFAFEGESLLISGNGANVGYIHYCNSKFNAYQRTYVLQNFKCDVFYLKNILHILLPKQIEREKAGGATPYIIMNTLLNLDIYVADDVYISKINNLIKSIDSISKLNKLELFRLKILKELLLNNLFI